MFIDIDDLRNGAVGGPIIVEEEYMLDIADENCVAFGSMKEIG